MLPQAKTQQYLPNGEKIALPERITRELPQNFLNEQIAYMKSNRNPMMPLRRFQEKCMMLREMF